MYGDLPILPLRERLKQWFCWHRPVNTDYYDYTCPKCGFVSDNPIAGVKLRHIIWWLTGRLPKDEED